MAERRNLTDGEIRAAKSVFGSHLDYGRVLVCRGLPLLPRIRAAVSPNGRIYFPVRHYLPDYTQAAAGYAVWLIHELTHVWQWQHGFHTWLGGLLLGARGGYRNRRAYRCPPPHTVHDFAGLNMEQQAEILARCFAVRHGYAAATPQEAAEYRRIAAAFLAQTVAFPPLPRYFCRITANKSPTD